MSLVPAVTELMLAELLYLQYDNPNKPIYMYINSTGVAVRFLYLSLPIRFETRLTMLFHPTFRREEAIN